MLSLVKRQSPSESLSMVSRSTVTAVLSSGMVSENSTTVGMHKGYMLRSKRSKKYVDKTSFIVYTSIVK